jgi:hypothetical protein
MENTLKIFTKGESADARGSRFHDRKHKPILDHEGIALEIANIAEAVAGHGYVAGGAARWLVEGDTAPPPEDVDIFCLASGREREIAAILHSRGYRFRGRQGQATAYKRPGALPVQVVPTTGGNPAQRRVGTPVEVLTDFTFTTEQYAIYSRAQGDGLREVWTDNARDDTAARRLRFNFLLSPIYATWRIGKYSRKGYRIAMRDVQALFAAWSEIPDERREAMLDVDAAGGDFYREMGKL